MMPDDFRLYAELWQEQIDRQELAELQAMAKNIARVARRKRVLDFSLSLGVVVLWTLIVWRHPASLKVMFGYLLIAAFAIWEAWRRHQITKAMQATAIQNPRAFFKRAIDNVRAERNLSTIVICATPLLFILCYFVISDLLGLRGAELLHLLTHKKIRMTIFVMTALTLSGIYFVRENVGLRAQLRRLENMSREWDEQHERDMDDDR